MTIKYFPRHASREHHGWESDALQRFVVLKYGLGLATPIVIQIRRRHLY